MIEKLWLTIKEARAEYGHWDGWWREKAHSGEIKAKLGAKITLERASIEAHLKDQPTPGKQGDDAEDAKLVKATREADLLGKRVAIAKSKRELATIDADVTVEQLREREKAIGELVGEVERILQEIVALHKKSEKGMSKEFRPLLNELVALINKETGKTVEVTE